MPPSDDATESKLRSWSAAAPRHASADARDFDDDRGYSGAGGSAHWSSSDACGTRSEAGFPESAWASDGGSVVMAPSDHAAERKQRSWNEAASWHGSADARDYGDGSAWSDAGGATDAAWSRDFGDGSGYSDGGGSTDAPWSSDSAFRQKPWYETPSSIGDSGWDSASGWESDVHDVEYASNSDVSDDAYSSNMSGAKRG